MSDCVAILNHGKLVQEGAPAQLYERPRTRFVADFLGKSNFIRCSVQEAAPGTLRLSAGSTPLVQSVPADLPRPAPGATLLLSLRPEKIGLLSAGESATNQVEGRIVTWSYLGAGFSLSVEVRDLGLLRVTLPAWGAPIAPAEGLPVRLGWSATASVPVEDGAT